MDPDATLSRIIDAAVRGDHDELLLAAEDLSIWLRRRGFAPLDPCVWHDHLPAPE